MGTVSNLDQTHIGILQFGQDRARSVFHRKLGAEVKCATEDVIPFLTQRLREAEQATCNRADIVGETNPELSIQSRDREKVTATIPRRFVQRRGQILRRQKDMLDNRLVLLAEQ